MKNLFGHRLLSYALLFAVLFGIVHLLGFRTYTNILSGTNPIAAWQMFGGLLYVLLYVCFVGLAPILLIAAGLFQGGSIVKRYLEAAKSERSKS